jgi:hypothetical protein
MDGGAFCWRRTCFIWTVDRHPKICPPRLVAKITRRSPGFCAGEATSEAARPRRKSPAPIRRALAPFCSLFCGCSAIGWVGLGSKRLFRFGTTPLGCQSWRTATSLTRRIPVQMSYLSLSLISSTTTHLLQIEVDWVGGGWWGGSVGWFVTNCDTLGDTA